MNIKVCEKKKKKKKEVLGGANELLHCFTTEGASE